MRYLDFVQKVFDALVSEAALNRESHRPPFVSDGQVGAHILPGVGFETGNPPQAVLLAVMVALRDLRALGVIQGERWNLRMTDLGTALVKEGNNLTLIWKPGIFQRTYIEDDQRALLRAIAEASEVCEDTFGSVGMIDVDQAMSDSGLAWDIYRRTETFKALLTKGAISGVLTSAPSARVTYAGIVLAFEEETTELQEMVGRLLAEGETPSVEFKRQLNLGTKPRNAEFARDIMALANSKVAGVDRYLLVGIDNNTRRRVADHEPAHEQERMEQILNEYLEPPTRIRLHTVAWERGTIGVIHIRRDPLLIPHRWKKSVIGGLQQGAVKVRHGSHVEDPSAAELSDLEAEGIAARSAPQPAGG